MEAQRWLRSELGKLDRGTWIDPAGGAQIALALRCALVNGTTARLYAGNGIVRESDPAAELVETRLKFQPLLTLLAAT